MSYLGIDLGTSGLRALIIDDAGKPVMSTERCYAVSNPRPGWSEQDPHDWIKALEGAVAELKARCNAFQEIRGMGVAGHMHGATLLDANDKVLRPCILWNDTRSEREAGILDNIPGYRDVSANIVFPGFTAPKLLWVKNNEPEIFQRTVRVLLPTAFLNLYLTGDYVADPSDSAGTSWLDVAQRCWSSDLLRAGDMNESQMPKLVEGCEKAGSLRPDLQQRWGLNHQVVVCGGAGDNAAAACGIGALDEGEGFVSLGTSGVVLVARDSFAPAPETAVHTFCHAVPERWYQMGVMLSATDSLNLLAGLVDRKPSELTEELGSELSEPGQIRFLPYPSGERTPHNDAFVRAAFTGISTGTARIDITRAVLEGVGFGLRDALEALKSTGVQIGELYAIGGGAASHYWLKLLATTFDLPLKLPRGIEFGAALGAARLARIAYTGCDPKDVVTAPDVGSVIEPVRSMSDQFNDAYQAFRAAYPAVRAVQ